jgi:hypothetical protein
MDIEAVARHCGLDWMLGHGACAAHEAGLRAFAARVAGAERAACIRACESQYQHDPESDFDSGVAACARALKRQASVAPQPGLRAARHR